MMDQLISNFTNQLMEALEIAEQAQIRKSAFPILNVYVAGLGGSGIGGNFTAEFIRDECHVPFCVGKGYSVPAYVNKNTLAIISSYSGNTEETLHSFKQIRERGAKIVVVSSGGELVEIAQKEKYDYVKLPNNWASPRACLGFSLVQQLGILHKLDLISNQSLKKVDNSVQLLRHEMEFIQIEAKSVAEQLNGKIPIIYITDRMESVALRLRQQINENSKALCWHNVFPEMNHNELVGWRNKDENLAVLYLRNDDDFLRNEVRMDISQDIIDQYTNTVISVFSKGESLIERALYLVHFGDWISWYLSQLRGMDAMEINVIDRLKSELAKVPF